MHSKELLSLLLSGAMMLSAMPMASAAYQTPVTVTSEAAIFNVTIPTALPVSVNDHGAVTTATNAVITNDSWGPIIISGLAVAGTNDWATVDYDSANMTAEKVNTKKVAMDINTCKTTGANAIDFQSSGFGSIHGKGGTQAINYDAKLPAQASAISSQNIVNTTFTVAWDSATDRSWDTNPMTSAQMTATGIPYYAIDDSNVGIGTSALSSSSGYTGSATILSLPSSIDGKRVTSIGKRAFRCCTGFKSVTIPSSVTSIGADAFSECAGLTSVTIPTSVTSISSGAFVDCTSLTSVTIPSSVTSIGAGAFSDCTGLTSATIQSGVTSIDNGAFAGCTSLTSVAIPSSVTSIGAVAFERVPHIYYSGTATGSPWGANAIN